MSAMGSIARFLAIMALAPTAVGCGSEGDVLPATNGAALQGRQVAGPQARQATGLSHLPRPRDFQELDRRLARHYPAELIGVRPRTSVLVDVDLDETGSVRDVRVVDGQAQPANAEAVLLDKAPGSNLEVQREYRPIFDDSFGPAAIAALKEVRFHPALREKNPVPYTLRMTVEFTSPVRDGGRT